MGNMVVRVIEQLLSQSPILLVCVAGLVLALVYWQRYPGPCLYVLISNGAMLLATVAQTAVIQYLLFKQSDAGWPHARLGIYISGVGLASQVIRAAALALLLAAVFVGRSAARQGPAAAGEGSEYFSPPS